MQPPVEEEKKETPGRKEIEEKGKRLPKDLCVISENCRDLFVKQISHQSKTQMKK
jgi:hypothetical protein